jgi:AraC family transcriptional regulator of adaptative response/methylated-DNA-[protein]-cysteine methyltransferase
MVLGHALKLAPAADDAGHFRTSIRPGVLLSESGQYSLVGPDTVLAHFNSFVPEPIMIAMAEPRTSTIVRYTIAACALGYVAIARTAKGLSAAFLGDDATELAAHMHERFAGAEEAEPDELTDRVVYALDNATDDSEIPVDPKGTDFQKSVWRALRDIPVGSTVSYSELARRIGKPESVRAVAAACGANPIAVIVPCHRVIGKDGSLTGYAWGGVEKKRMLLEREKTRSA